MVGDVLRRDPPGVPAGTILRAGQSMDEAAPKAPGSGKRLVGSLFGKVQSAGAAALQGVKQAGSTAVAERFGTKPSFESFSSRRRCIIFEKSN